MITASVMKELNIILPFLKNYSKIPDVIKCNLFPYTTLGIFKVHIFFLYT